MPVCPVCGTYFEKINNFCTECGNRLIEASEGQDQSAEASSERKPTWQQKYAGYRQSYDQYNGKIDRQYTVPAADRTAADSGKTVSIVSLVFGILGFVACFFPPFSITGLITGIIGVAKSGRIPARIGLILSVISLALFTVALIITAINGFDFSMLSRYRIFDFLQS